MVGLFPGSEKAIARFPSLATLHELFFDVGFHLLCDDRVEEELSNCTRPVRTSLRRMRDADSILTALSDAEVDAGIAALRSRSSEIEHFALSLLVFSTA